VALLLATVALTAVPGRAAPPPLAFGTASPYDALLPFETPYPTADLVHHLTGAPAAADCAPGFTVCNDQFLGHSVSYAGRPVTVDGVAGSAPFAIRDEEGGADLSAHHRGPVLVFDHTTHGQEIQLFDVDLRAARPELGEIPSRPPGLTVALWYRRPTAPPTPALVPLFVLEGPGTIYLGDAHNLSLVLRDGVPLLVTGDGDKLDQPNLLVDDDAIDHSLYQQRVDDGLWHHVALNLQLVCHRGSGYAANDCSRRSMALTSDGGVSLPDQVYYARLTVDGTPRAETYFALPPWVELTGDGPVYHLVEFRGARIGSYRLPTQAPGEPAPDLTPWIGQANAVDLDTGAPRLATWGELDDVFVFERSLSVDEINRLRARVEAGLRLLATPYGGEGLPTIGEPVAELARTDGYTAPNQSLTAASLDGPTALVGAGDLRREGVDAGPFSAFTVLGWLRPVAGADSTVILRTLAAEAGTDAPFAVGSRLLGPERRVVFGPWIDAGGVPNDVERRSASLDVDTGYAWNEWVSFAHLQRHGVHEAMLGAHRVPRRACESFGCPPIPGVAAVTAAGVPGAPFLGLDHAGGAGLEWAWLALFDHVMTPAEQLAYAAAGPQFWALRDPASATGGYSVFTPEARYEDYAGEGLAVPTRYTALETGAAYGGSAPFTFVARFALEVPAGGFAHGWYPIARRAASFAEGAGADVEIRLFCEGSTCSAVGIVTIAEDDAGDDVFVFERPLLPTPIEGSQTLHTLGVSWAPGREATTTSNGALVRARSRLAVDGETVDFDAVSITTEESAFINARIPLGDPGIADQASDEWHWRIGGEHFDVVEARLYGRAIEHVDDIATLCRPEDCGGQRCADIGELANAAAVGSRTCYDCAPGYLPIAHGADGQPSECLPGLSFGETCGGPNDSLCATGDCDCVYGGLLCSCTTTDAALAEHRCAVLGLETVTVPSANPEALPDSYTCGGCRTGYAPVVGTGVPGAPDYQCAWAPTLEAGAPCDADAECLSGGCVEQIVGYDYGVSGHVEASTAKLHDSINCGIHYSTNDTFQWEWASLNPTTQTPRRCAARTATECARLGQVAEERSSLVDGVIPVTYEVCGAGQLQCAEGFRQSWDVLSAQACSTLWAATYAPNGPTTFAQADAAYDVLQNCSAAPPHHYGQKPRWDVPAWRQDLTQLTALDAPRDRLLDVLWGALVGTPPPSASGRTYTPAELSELEARGVGPKLLTFITRPDLRQQMIQDDGPFLPLANCGSFSRSHTSYDSDGSVTGALSPATWAYPGRLAPDQTAFDPRDSNTISCAAKRQDDGAPCPLAGYTGALTGHAFCKSRYCAVDTHLCTTGGRTFEQLRGNGRNDHNTGKQGVSFGVIRCDSSNLSIFQDCDATVLDNVCGDQQDNDGDGLTDAADPDCGATETRVEIGGQLVSVELRESLADDGECDNGIDDDGDGQTDSADTDCDPKRGLWLGEQPPCPGGSNDGNWRYTADLSQTYSLCLFGHRFPSVPLLENDVDIDHSRGAACGSSSLATKILGIKVNIPARPLTECHANFEIDPVCAELGGDNNLSVSAGCSVTAPHEFLIGNALQPPTAKVCVPLDKLPGIGPALDKARFERDFQLGPVPIHAEIALTLDVCVEAFLGLSADADGQGLPKVELKPVVAIGAEARAGIGKKAGKFAEAFVGVRLALTFVSLSFPVTFATTLELSCYDSSITAGDARVSCGPGSKVTLDLVFSVNVKLALEILSGAMGLIAELKAGPVSLGKSIDLFKWGGIVFTKELARTTLGRYKLDFEFDPVLHLGGGEARPICDGECQ